MARNLHQRRWQYRRRLPAAENLSSFVSRKQIFALLVVAVCLILSALAARHVTSTRVVVRTTTPNGIDFCIIQRFDDPFKTSAFYRKDGRWGVFYYHHEDWYWGKGTAKVESNMLNIYRAGKLTATVDWKAEAF